jgi:hypothetical protein
VETYDERRRPIANQERQQTNRFVEEIQKDPEKVMRENDEIRQPRAKRTSRFVDMEEGESRSVKPMHSVANETGGGANGRHVRFSSQITELKSYARSKTRGRPFCEPDQIRDENHPETADVSHCRGFDGPGQHGNGRSRYERSNTSVGPMKKPTKSSVLPEDRGKAVYPPVVAPKAPDKGFRRVQEGHRTEVYTPQSGKGAALDNQSRLGKKVLTRTRQQSPCNRGHTSRVASHKRVANVGRVGGTSSARKVARGYWEDEDEDSWSSGTSEEESTSNKGCTLYDATRRRVATGASSQLASG